MLKLNESQAKELVAELAAKCVKRWNETVDKTRFMDELKEGKKIRWSLDVDPQEML